MLVRAFITSVMLLSHLHAPSVHSFRHEYSEKCSPLSFLIESTAICSSMICTVYWYCICGTHAQQICYWCLLLAHILLLNNKWLCHAITSVLPWTQFIKKAYKVCMTCNELASIGWQLSIPRCYRSRYLLLLCCFIASREFSSLLIIGGWGDVPKHSKHCASFFCLFVCLSFSTTPGARWGQDKNSTYYTTLPYTL